MLPGALVFGAGLTIHNHPPLGAAPRDVSQPFPIGAKTGTADVQLYLGLQLPIDHHPPVCLHLGHIRQSRAVLAECQAPGAVKHRPRPPIRNNLLLVTCLHHAGPALEVPAKHHMPHSFAVVRQGQRAPVYESHCLPFLSGPIPDGVRKMPAVRTEHRPPASVGGELRPFDAVQDGKPFYAGVPNVLAVGTEHRVSRGWPIPLLFLVHDQAVFLPMPHDVSNPTAVWAERDLAADTVARRAWNTIQYQAGFPLALHNICQMAAVGRKSWAVHVVRRLVWLAI